MFSAFNLDREEISFLKLLTQLDLLITEQFLFGYFMSLNIAPNVGTRESTILSSATRKKISDVRLN